MNNNKQSGLFFVCAIRCDNNTTPYNALIISERFIDPNSIVSEDSITNPNGIFPPMVTKGFEIAEIIMVTVYL